MKNISHLLNIVVTKKKRNGYPVFNHSFLKHPELILSFSLTVCCCLQGMSTSNARTFCLSFCWVVWCTHLPSQRHVTPYLQTKDRKWNEMKKRRRRIRRNGCLCLEVSKKIEREIPLFIQEGKKNHEGDEQHREYDTRMILKSPSSRRRTRTFFVVVFTLWCWVSDSSKDEACDNDIHGGYIHVHSSLGNESRDLLPVVFVIALLVSSSSLLSLILITSPNSHRLYTSMENRQDSWIYWNVQ